VTIMASLGPVFALLMLGWVLKRSKFPGDAFWPSVERLIYFICFPALLVVRLADADFEGEIALQLVWSILVLLGVATLALLALQRFVRFDGAAFTSVYQGSIRFNTYIALAIAAGVVPGDGVVYAAIITAVMIPPLNVLCVLMFALFKDDRPSPRRVVITILQNPLILACLIGIAINMSHIELPDLLVRVLALLAQIALPMGLLAVGAALQFRSLKTSKSPLFVALLFRALLMPLFALVVGALFALPADAMQILLVFVSVPAASAAYILARQLGGDAPLMAAILSAQSVMAMVTIPLVLAAGLWIYPILLGYF